jgi:hypothetical protein
MAGPANITGSNAMTAASARQVLIQLDGGRGIPGAFPKISSSRLAAGACHASAAAASPNRWPACRFPEDSLVDRSFAGSAHYTRSAILKKRGMRRLDAGAVG